MSADRRGLIIAIPLVCTCLSLCTVAANAAYRTRQLSGVVPKSVARQGRWGSWLKFHLGKHHRMKCAGEYIAATNVMTMKIVEKISAFLTNGMMRAPRTSLFACAQLPLQRHA